MMARDPKEEVSAKIRTDTYTVEDIMCILRIGRNAAYELVHSGAFAIVRIGNSIRIPARIFNEWLNKGCV